MKVSKISVTGDGLRIVISCGLQRCHDWMAFASWYSIKKNLPDAEVVLFCETGCTDGLFRWAYRLRVKYIQRNKDFSDWLEMPPYVMAIRPYDEINVGPVDANSSKVATFVSYIDGCGKFVVSRWIDKEEPFANAIKRFSTDNITVNELKILKLWQQMQGMYSMM